MKKVFILLAFVLTIIFGNQYCFGAGYPTWKCNWKEIKFDNKNFYDAETIIEKSKNEMLFFSKRTKDKNLILSYTSDRGNTWERDSFLYTGNYLLNSKNQIYVYDRPIPRLNIINAWTMFKRGKMINIPIYIGDAFFELNDSLLVAMPRFDINAKTNIAYLINLNDSTARPLGPRDSTGEICEEFQHTQYVYKSSVPNRICFINYEGNFYYSDNLGDSITLFYHDYNTFLRAFPSNNGMFYYCRQGSTFQVQVLFNGKPKIIDLFNIYIIRLKSEEGVIDTVFHTYTQPNNMFLNSSTAKLNNKGQYISLITNNDSLFYSSDYGDHFYMVQFPQFINMKNVTGIEAGITSNGEIVLKCFDSTAGGKYFGAIGKPYPNPYSVDITPVDEYKIYTTGDIQRIEFGDFDFLNSAINIELYNIFGQKIKNFNYLITESTIEINTSQLAKGVYFLTIENYEKRMAIKLLISN